MLYAFTHVLIPFLIGGALSIYVIHRIETKRLRKRDHDRL